MKFLDLVITANRNLTRSKLRTLLTILAIFVGGFTLTLTTALNTGANEYLQRQLGNVSVPGVFEVFPRTDFNPLGSDEVKEYNADNKQLSAAESFTTPNMTRDDQKKLQSIEGVDRVDPFYTVNSEYIQYAGGKKFQPGMLMQHFGLNLDLAAGRLPNNDDKFVVILPETYLEAFNLSAKDAVNKHVTIAYKNLQGELVQQQLTVVGVMRKTFVTAGQTYIDVHAAQTIAQAQGQSDRFLSMMVTFDGTTKADEAGLKSRIEAAGNYSTTSLEERIGTFISIIGAVTAALNVVGVIALFAASFGIINTLLMSVYERTQEIGLMKALGLRRAKVFSLFAIEAALVGFWGSLVAVLSAWGVSVLVSNWASTSFLKDFEGFVLLVVTPQGGIGVVLLIMLISFLAGTLPAIKASRLNPIDALRSE